MEFECFMCKTRVVAAPGQYFCSDCKDSYMEIEICINDEPFEIPCKFEPFILATGSKTFNINTITRILDNKGPRSNKKIQASAIFQKQREKKENEKTASIKQVSKCKNTSVDDQDIPDDGLGINEKIDEIFKLYRNSKKIYKSRDKTSRDWKQNYSEQVSNNPNPFLKVNYSSIGNENSHNIDADFPLARSISTAPTELKSKSVSTEEVLEVYKETFALKNSHEKPTKSIELDPIELASDGNSDVQEINSKSISPSRKFGKNEVLLSKNNKKTRVNEQELLRDGKMVLEEQLAEATAELMSSNTEQETFHVTNIDLQGVSRDKLADDDEEIQEVEIGEDYQCSIPPLMDRSRIQQNPRRFKLVSGPSIIDPKVVETVESYVCQNLKVTNISREKMVRMLREFDFKIPEFFAEIKRDKENSKNRLTWKKERRLY